MARDAKVTVSVDRAVLESVDAESRRRGLSRSALVEEALRTWQQVELHRRLAEGYAANREAAAREAEEWLPLAAEVLYAERSPFDPAPPRRRVARRVPRKRK